MKNVEQNETGINSQRIHGISLAGEEVVVESILISKTA